MDMDSDTIGRIVEIGPDSILWEIPGWILFVHLQKKNVIRLWSPHIRLAETEWFLAIFPNGTKEFPDQILLFLRRCGCGDEPEKSFHCTVGVKRADGNEETVGTQTVKFRFLKDVLYRFDNRSEEGEYLFDNTNTFTLTLRIREGETASPGVEILSKHVKDMLENTEDCDVKICVNEKVFQAHKCILKSRSPVFRMMLTHDCEENNSGVIRIKDCDTEAFEELLFYMYSGKTRDLTPTKAIHLCYIADKYSFPELKEQCVRFLKPSLSTSNICDVILLSAKHEDTHLLNIATYFFERNIEEILKTVEWQNFKAKHPTEANELYKYKGRVTRWQH